ncbi:MAG TPA: hypothetical protein VEL11_16315 [Candidatus Bathyarchaeia archaeon]|nr:hypothetical protein [Candidatus Bathyarchaeia archaeon]
MNKITSVMSAVIAIAGILTLSVLAHHAFAQGTNFVKDTGKKVDVDQDANGGDSNGGYGGNANGGNGSIR